MVDKPIVTAELGKNLNASAVTEGIDVYFVCKYKSNLDVTKITWKQDVSMVDEFFASECSSALLTARHARTVFELVFLASSFYFIRFC